MKLKPILLVGVILVAAIGAGEYYAGAFGSPDSQTVNISILGGVGGGTVDEYQPNTFTVKEGQKVTLAILNTDDNTHGLAIRAFGVDTGKILPGHTDRVSFVANQTGTFEYFEPPGYCGGGFDNHCNSVQNMLGNMTVVP